MNNEYSLNQSRRTRRFFSGTIVILLLLLVWRVSAQSGNDGDWTEPLNLSLSGTAVQPALAVAPSGDVYLFWQDRLAGYQYTVGSGQDWQPPVKVLVPFTEPPFSPVVGVADFEGFYKPDLIIDQNNTLHAFWSGAGQTLLYSRTALLENGELEAWTPVQSLSEVVSGMSAIVGPDNALHVAYIQPSMDAESPSGVYYRHSPDGGVTWAEPQLLYQSDYLRSLAVENTNIKTAVNDNGQIFVVWDDPLLEKVFVAYSPAQEASGSGPLDEPLVENVAADPTSDLGANWSDPLIVDQRLPDDAPESPGPANIDIVAKGTEIHLVWQGGREQQQCSIYHQLSPDGGQSWELAQQVLDTGSPECSNLTRLFWGENGLLFLLIKVISPLTERSELFLQAWDGEQWSDAVLQEPLSSFMNPQTFRQVDFSCQQPQVTPGNHLLVIGCGLGMDADIWGLERPLGDLYAWFPNPEGRTWSLPDSLFESSMTVKSPTLVTDAQGDLHAFWIETDATDFEADENRLYHAQWDGTAWSRPVPVVNLGTTMADQLTAVSLPGGRLLVTWYDSVTNTYFLRQIESERVRFPSDWSSPLPLPVPHELISRPSFFVSPNGVIYLTYAVPFNEGRGIYAIHSADDGATWTDPALIADATANEWLMVDQPFLLQTANGQLHALWTEGDLQPDPAAVALHYTRSSDDSQQWEKPVLVAEGNVRWSRLAQVGEQGVVIVWQQASANGMQLWSRQSFDGGVSWERPVPLRSFGEPASSPALTTDPAGQLHLVQLLADREESLIIQEWVNSGDNWDIGDNEMMGLNRQQLAITGMASGVAQDNQLVTIFSGERIITGETSETAKESIYATLRDIDLLPVNPDTALTTAATRAPTSTPPIGALGNEEEVEITEAEPTVAVIPTVVPLVSANTPAGILSSTSILVRVGISVAPAVAFIVIALFVWRLRRTRQPH